MATAITATRKKTENSDSQKRGNRMMMETVVSIVVAGLTWTTSQYVLQYFYRVSAAAREHTTGQLSGSATNNSRRVRASVDLLKKRFGDEATWDVGPAPRSNTWRVPPAMKRYWTRNNEYSEERTCTPSKESMRVNASCNAGTHNTRTDHTVQLDGQQSDRPVSASLSGWHRWRLRLGWIRTGRLRGL